MATHSSILAWRIPWTEEPGRLQSPESQRVGHNLVTKPSSDLREEAESGQDPENFRRAGGWAAQGIATGSSWKTTQYSYFSKWKEHLLLAQTLREMQKCK